VYKWPLINDNISQSDREVLADFILNSNRFTNGPKVKEFEKKWSEWLGVKHTVFVNSGASANYMMASIVKELKGVGEVIVPPLGWVSDISPLVNLGMTPVFVDIELNNLALSIEKVEKAISANTKAIILVHALGFNGINSELIKVAKKNDLFLIEDCCESHGATFDGKKVGSIGDMSNFSFYFGHHITTIEGGVVCTDDDEIYEYAKLFRSHGMTREASDDFKQKYIKKYPDLNPLFTFAVPGYNMRNTEINAVLGIEQLKRLNLHIERRTENLKTWLDNLDSDKYFVNYDMKGSSNFALPLIMIKKDKGLFKRVCKLLYNNKVEFRIGTAGGGNQVRQPYLKEGKYDYYIFQSLKNADHVHFYGLYVGNHTELTSQQILSLCERLNNV